MPSRWMAVAVERGEISSRGWSTTSGRRGLDVRLADAIVMAQAERHRARIIVTTDARALAIDPPPALIPIDPGAAAAAQSHEEFGMVRGVSVFISEFQGAE